MDLEYIQRMCSHFVNRNRIILNQPHSIPFPREVNLHWWQMHGEKQNVGDSLSPVVVEYVKTYKQIQSSTAVKGTIHLYGIGSIIDGGYQNATVWGSGVLRGDRKFWWRFVRRLDIRCVRGPETRRVLLDNGYNCPEVYGDPALLLPLIYQPENKVKETDYLVIQHHSIPNSDPYALDPVTDDWKSFIDAIVKCKRVVSSSLHGIILAEAYGVPAVLLANNPGLFKYKDYYYSTGRYEFPIAESVEEALKIEPAALPDIRPLQENLLNSFPEDLWKK